MAGEEHVALLKQGVVVWNKWREENPDIKANLRGTTLIEANLCGANLSRADLDGADLGEADRIHSPPPDQAGRGMARCGKPRRASARRLVMKAQASTPRRRQVSRTLMVAA